jgi:hypothetical protein
MRVEVQRPPSNSFGGFDTGRFSAEVDLQCAREHWATVHVLNWAIDHHGDAVNKVCTCSTCPTGANTRPWPTKFELQDAGAPSNVPRDDVAGPSEPGQTLSERLEASAHE